MHTVVSGQRELTNVMIQTAVYAAAGPIVEEPQRREMRWGEGEGLTLGQEEEDEQRYFNSFNNRQQRRSEREEKNKEVKKTEEENDKDRQKHWRKVEEELIDGGR